MMFIFQGALDMKHKTVKTAMLPLEDVSMLNINTVLDQTNMKSVCIKNYLPLKCS